MCEELLAGLFPNGVAVSALKDFAAAEPLHATELPAVARAVSKRRREFAAGRTCARSALLRAGCSGRPGLPARADRTVCWPDGFTGSISHADGLAAAAVARMDGGVQSVGLDVERLGRLGEKLYPYIAHAEEIAWMRDQADRAAALFSAKEAFYKAQYPISATFLGFHDVRFHARDDGFEVEVLRALPGLAAEGDCFPGRLAFSDAYVFAGVTVLASMV